MKPDPERLRAVFNRLERLIEDRWGVPVRIQDVPNPFTGDLDGGEIMVDYDLDQWISDFAACDSAYLMHLYRTGEKRPFRSFWRDATPLATPLAIPEFQPTQWLSRHQGTVV